MNVPFPQDDLSSIMGRIGTLQASAKRTLPMFIVGILATMVAAGVAIYYIVSLSGDLDEARRALRQSEQRLAAAQQNLMIANDALRRVRTAGTSPANRLEINAAISDVARSQQQLRSASASVREAASRLPASTSGKTDDSGVAVPAPGWFAVVGSYRLDATGIGNANAQVQRMKAAGFCAEIWQTRISRNYAVVFGTMGDRATAFANAARMRAAGLADDAFAQPDREWIRLAQSPQC